MKKKISFKILIELFAVFFKIGIATFGGGLAMLPLMAQSCCDKKKWLKQEEMFDMVAISESTPGPIAVNTATYVGFKVQGFLGALFATLGLMLPSFFIILIVSMFYKTFMEIAFIQWAFKGIKIGVIILVFMAMLRLYKILNKTAFNIIILFIAFAISFISQFLNLRISFGSFDISINLCLILLGLIMGLIKTLKSRGKQA